MDPGSQTASYCEVSTIAYSGVKTVSDLFTLTDV
jgi:hypothetical protein